jgi:hypothetical protein
MGDVPGVAHYRRNWNGIFVPSDAQASDEPDLGPLTPDHFDRIIHGLAFFEQHPELSCVWEFNEGEGELLGLTLEPGINLIPDTDYAIVCVFGPGKLIIHSPVALRAGTFHFGVSHGILFDSNIYDRIVRFVESPERMRSQDHAGTRRLLETIIIRKYDYQMMPYILESFARNTAKGGYDYAYRVTRAILRLHMMDKERFMQDGSIVPDPAKAALYEVDFGTVDVDQIVEAQLEPYMSFEEIPRTVKLNLIALLWMVLCRRGSVAKASFDAQFAAFDDFMFERTGIFSGTLRQVAMFYFAGALDRWIKVQRDSKAVRAFAGLSNSAWDLYLGALPMQILASSPEERPVITHFCTREMELAKLLSASRTTTLEVMANGSFNAVREMDFSALLALIGSGAESALRRADDRARALLNRRKEGASAYVSPAGIDELLAELTTAFDEQIGRQR